MLTLLIPVALVAQSLPPPLAFSDPFILFFDYASAELDAEDDSLVANIYEAIEASKSRRIEIVGHADRKGSSSFNLALSRRRAEAVKAALVSRAVPDNAITINGVGEDRPIIDTPDGVPELQNRYVTVMLYLALVRGSPMSTIGQNDSFSATRRSFAISCAAFW